MTVNNYNAGSPASGGGSGAGAEFGGAGSSGGGGGNDATLPDFSDISTRIDEMQKTVLNLPNQYREPCHKVRRNRGELLSQSFSCKSRAAI